MRETHNKDKLCQQQRHGKDPVDIAVRIVERDARAQDFSVDGPVAFVETVEDTEVVVEGNCGDQGSDDHSGTEPRVNQGELEEEENGSRTHTSDSEGQHVVNDVELRSCEADISFCTGTDKKNKKKR